MDLKSKWLLGLAGGIFALGVGIYRSKNAESPAPLATKASASKSPSHSTGPDPSVISPEAALAYLAADAQADADRAREKLHALVREKFALFRQTSTEDEETQARLNHELLALLTDANAGDLVSFLSAEELSTPLGLAALDRWLKIDAPRALAWVSAQGTIADAQTYVIARRLLEVPGRLDSFVAQLPNTEWKQQFLSTAALEAAGTDTALALKLAQAMSAGDAQTNVVETAVYGWMTKDPMAASQWIAQVTDPALRDRLLAVSVKAIAVTDPDLAAGWLKQAFASEGPFAEAALSVVENWISRDPLKTSAWVAQLPPGRSRDAAIEIVVQKWLSVDPSAAAAWIASLPERQEILARVKDQQEAGATKLLE